MPELDAPLGGAPLNVRVLPASVAFSSVAIVASAYPATVIRPITGQLAVQLRADSTNAHPVFVAAGENPDATDWYLAAGDTLTVATSAPLWVIAPGNAGMILHVIQTGQ